MMGRTIVSWSLSSPCTMIWVAQMRSHAAAYRPFPAYSPLPLIANPLNSLCTRS